MMISKRKFEPAVHLGLLVIVFVLLFLNFRSNMTIYHAGAAKQSSVAVQFNNAALSIGRSVQKENIRYLEPDRQHILEQKHRLSSVTLLTSSLSKESPDRLDHLLRLAGESILQLRGTKSADPLSQSDLKNVLRGDGDQYFYLCPVGRGPSAKLLILSQAVPELAYLEDSGRTLILINVIAVSLIVILYFVLFRLILSPFRRIKRQAINAGRDVAGGRDEVEAMVDDYQKIIDELKDKETQLLDLNRAIQEKADRLELFNQYLLQSTSSGVLMIDGDGKLMSMNKAVCSMVRIDPKDYVGRDYVDLPTFCAKILAPVKGMLESDANQSYREHDVVTPDGNILSLGVTVSSIRDYSSSKVGASVFISDLTEIKSLRGEVEARNRLVALGEMAGGLAHQLRNSIGAIAGYGLLVKKRMAKNDLEIDSITALEEEAKEAELLVDRFLKFARPFDLMPEKTGVYDIVDDLMKAFRVRPEISHVDFSVSDSMPVGLMAEIDPLLIKQALANIVENAVNAYDGQPGKVEIILSAEMDSVIIRVRDCGAGIAAENLEKIFTPFYSSRPSGTGLGLPLAKKIIDLHHGRLSVMSSPGEGTTFALTLPLVQSERQLGDARPAHSSK